MAGPPADRVLTALGLLALGRAAARHSELCLDADRSWRVREASDAFAEAFEALAVLIEAVRAKEIEARASRAMVKVPFTLSPAERAYVLARQARAALERLAQGANTPAATYAGRALAVLERAEQPFAESLGEPGVAEVSRRALEDRQTTEPAHRRLCAAVL